MFFFFVYHKHLHVNAHWDQNSQLCVVMNSPSFACSYIDRSLDGIRLFRDSVCLVWYWQRSILWCDVLLFVFLFLVIKECQEHVVVFFSAYVLQISPQIFCVFCLSFLVCVFVCIFIYLMRCVGRISVLVIPDRLLGSVQWGHHQYLTVEHKPRHDIPTCRDTKTNAVLFFAHFQ